MSRKETSPKISTHALRRPWVAEKRSSLLRRKPFIRLLTYPSDGGPPRLHMIKGSENELDDQIARLDQEFEKNLRKAMMLGTAIFFFSYNLFERQPPNLEGAALHASFISYVITGKIYGSPENPGYQNLLQEIEKIDEEGEGTITLMGWRSRLVLKKDQEGNQILTIDPDSDKVIRTHFHLLAYILNFNNGEIPINDVCPWADELDNWNEFLSQSRLNGKTLIK